MEMFYIGTEIQSLLAYSILRNMALIQGLFNIWMDPYFGPLSIITMALNNFGFC